MSTAGTDVAEPVGHDRLADRVALESLFRSYRRDLTRYFLRRHATMEEAADLVQEVYCRLAARPGIATLQFQKAFLFRTADNLLKDRRRQIKTRHTFDHIPLEPEALSSTEASQEQQICGQQELALLRTAILEMAPRCRQVFLLHRLDNMSYPEIARHCAISVSMVEKHISRALAICRARLRGEPPTLQDR